MTGPNRRQFLSLLGTAGAASMAGGRLLAAPAPRLEPFTFLFFTDAHLQPELNGVLGTDMAFKHARSIKADFAIQGGDHVFDVNGVSKARAVELYDLYGKTEQDLGLKVHHTLGNHDIFGIARDSGVAADPLYGRRMYEERFGKTFYTFDHKGRHFIVLDTIGLTDDHSFEGRIDPEQVAWLKADLAGLAPYTPIVVVAHIPLVTAYQTYLPPPATPYAHNYFSVVNAWEILPLFEGHNVLGVLQGHTHVNERIVWKGVPYLTSGAVCGDWWKGAHMGVPEGYTVVTVGAGELTTRYETYGFKAVGATGS